MDQILPIHPVNKHHEQRRNPPVPQSENPTAKSNAESAADPNAAEWSNAGMTSASKATESATGSAKSPSGNPSTSCAVSAISLQAVSASRVTASA